MRRIQRRTGDDAGVGLILVIGMSTIIMGLVVLGSTVAARSLASSDQHVSFSQALAAAENGIDQTTARLQRAYVYYSSDFPVPNTGTTMDPTPTCNAASVSVPAAGFPGGDERAWAKAQLTSLLTSHPECLQHGAQGDFIVLKPANRQTVYSMGFAPKYGAANVKTRLIKAEYLFVPYRPTNAVLTGGSLELDSSTKVTTVPGVDPTLASIHSNGTITVPNGNPSVSGPVSSTDPSASTSNNFTSNPGGTITTSPQQNVTVVSAQSVYSKYAVSNYAGWYDLCPDGKVKHPTSAGPCASTSDVDLVADLSSSGAQYGQAFRGFTYLPATDTTPPTWLVGKDVPDGVYYAYASNIAPSSGAGNTTTANATILAQALDSDTDTGTGCPKYGGSISWDHNNISAPYLPNLFMMAEADLATSANFTAGGINSGTVTSGLFVAGDQIDMQTSSNGAYGAVVAAGECPADPGETNVIKNPSIYYDPYAEAPFTDIINTTLWLEYVG